MATIMTQGNSEGTRRCDGTCHKAKKKACKCICGGRFHGCGGSDKARELLVEAVRNDLDGQFAVFRQAMKDSGILETLQRPLHFGTP